MMPLRSSSSRRLIVAVLGVVLLVPVARAGDRPISAPAKPAPPPAERVGRLAPAEAMDRILPLVDFDRTPLRRALDDLARTAGVNFEVHWAALHDAGVASDTPVSLRLERVTLGAALESLLRTADQGGGMIDYTIRGGIVVITSAERLAAAVETRVYDCAALVRAAPSAADERRVERAVSRTWWRSFGICVPPWMRGSDARDRPREAAPAGGADRQGRRIMRELADALFEERMARLQGLIEETIEPHTWRSRGGAYGVISRFDTRLVIVQTARNHAAIGRLLRELESGRSPDRK